MTCMVSYLHRLPLQIRLIPSGGKINPYYALLSFGWGEMQELSISCEDPMTASRMLHYAADDLDRQLAANNPKPDPVDRLSLIEARRCEQGGGDGDCQWLIDEVKKLRRRLAASSSFLDEALNSGKGEYKP